MLGTGCPTLRSLRTLAKPGFLKIVLIVIVIITIIIASHWLHGLHWHETAKGDAGLGGCEDLNHGSRPGLVRDHRRDR
jgi:hypothetical protein